MVGSVTTAGVRAGAPGTVGASLLPEDMSIHVSVLASLASCSRLAAAVWAAWLGSVTIAGVGVVAPGIVIALLLLAVLSLGAISTALDLISDVRDQ